MDTKIHQISECEECKRLMKTEGKACKKFYDEAIKDDNFIANVIDMEKYE